MNQPFSPHDPRAVVQAGDRIYAERYRESFERLYAGQFAAVDTRSGQAFVAAHPEVAIANAQAALGDPLIYLIRIGDDSAYRVSFVQESFDADVARVL